jgi:hypothetical protein
MFTKRNMVFLELMTHRYLTLGERMSTPLIHATTTQDIHGFFTTIFPAPVIATRDPLATDTGYEVGQVWINSAVGAGGGNTVNVLTSYNGAIANWSQTFP